MPVLVFVTMVVVGTELTIADFRRVARQPRLIVAATLGQILLLPLLGWLIARALPYQLAVAQGILLVTACPSGTMANLYTLLGRGNVALSVTLTAVSCLAAVVATPLALAVLQLRSEELAAFPVPLGMLMAQLFVLLVVPVLGGMAVRRRWPNFAQRYGRVLLGFGVVSLAALLLLVIVNEAEQFAHAFADLAAAAGILTVVGLGAGWATCWASGGKRTDRFTVGMVFVVRNVGIATAIAVTALGRIEFAVFATAYFLAQTPILLAVALVFRAIRRDAERPLLGVENP